MYVFHMWWLKGVLSNQILCRQCDRYIIDTYCLAEFLTLVCEKHQMSHFYKESMLSDFLSIFLLKMHPEFWIFDLLHFELSICHFCQVNHCETVSPFVLFKPDQLICRFSLAYRHSTTLFCCYSWLTVVRIRSPLLKAWHNAYLALLFLLRNLPRQVDRVLSAAESSPPLQCELQGPLPLLTLSDEALSTHSHCSPPLLLLRQQLSCCSPPPLCSRSAAVPALPAATSLWQASSCRVARAQPYSDMLGMTIAGSAGR